MPESTGAQGRLAQMIATRGGLAPPEAPFVIEHREALIYMLCEAAELEHGIMCQYLYAAFSLRSGVEEGLSPAEAEAVLRWRRTILNIAWRSIESRMERRRSFPRSSPRNARSAGPRTAQRYTC